MASSYPVTIDCKLEDLRIINITLVAEHITFNFKDTTFIIAGIASATMDIALVIAFTAMDTA